jgi:hypothetical protein
MICASVLIKSVGRALKGYRVPMWLFTLPTLGRAGEGSMAYASPSPFRFAFFSDNVIFLRYSPISSPTG